MAFNEDAVGIQAALVEVQDRIEQFRHIGAVRESGLAVETERLLRDFGDAAPFPFGHGHVLHGRFVEIAEVPQQVKQIGNGFQRIVDLVGN